MRFAPRLCIRAVIDAIMYAITYVTYGIMCVMIGATLVGIGCSPTLEDPVSEGGLSPDPTATLRGSLTYTGLRPLCDTNGEIQGLALLNLFSTAAPPPPQGNGLPVSLLLIRGDELFRNGVDCRQPGDTTVISRTAEFTWPSIPLDSPAGGPATYILLATWDTDRNLNPLFSVRASPTLGDVLGGAIENPMVSPTQTVLAVGPTSDWPDGQLLEGVNVTVALPVSTEVPLARLSTTTRPLDSEAPLPVAPELPVLEAALLSLTDAAIELPDILDEDYAAALGVARLELSVDPVARAWYVATLDLDADGTPDPHPVLGDVAGVPVLTPIVSMSRARTPAEVAAGVPEVFLFPHPVADRAVKAQRVPLAIPPVAVVRLNPLDPTCDIPYFAPGNFAPIYELGGVCTELPTGAYNVAVVHGLAGAIPRPAGPEVSETGFELAGGQFSGQFWTIPNELGPPDTRYNPFAVSQLDEPGATETLTLPDQGPEGRFFVSDFDPSGGTPSERPACQQAPDFTGTVRPIQFVPVPSQCCAPVAPLCNLPLCPEQALPDDQGATRELETLDGDGRPTCVPFEIPPSCCS